MKLYSPSSAAFYDPALDYPSLPGDVLEISDEEHTRLLEAQGTGKRIVAGADGMPELADQAAGTFHAGAALARARDARKPILDALAGVGFDALASGDAATVAAVRAARQGLLDITKAPDVLAATGDDSFDAAVMSHYRGLAATAPEVVRSAFRDLLS